MNNLFPDSPVQTGFLAPLVNRLMKEQPQETDLVLSGGLTVFCAIVFFKKLKDYLIHNQPAL